MMTALTYRRQHEPLDESTTLVASDFRAMADVIRAAITAGVHVTRVTLDLDFVLAYIECPEERSHLAARLGLTRCQVSGRTERWSNANADVVLAGPVEVDAEDDDEPSIHDLHTTLAEQHREADREDQLL